MSTVIDLLLYNGNVIGGTTVQRFFKNRNIMGQEGFLEGFYFLVQRVVIACQISKTAAGGVLGL